MLKLAVFFAIAGLLVWAVYLLSRGDGGGGGWDRDDDPDPPAPPSGESEDSPKRLEPIDRD
ncbi:MAG: hypothetical protein AAFQ67_03070 [Pseudomonadota bacterium]